MDDINFHKRVRGDGSINSNKHGIEQVVYLTCQHDSDSLLDALVQTLTEILPKSNIRLYFRARTTTTSPLLLLHSSLIDPDQNGIAADDRLLASLLDEKAENSAYPSESIEPYITPIIYGGGIYGALACDFLDDGIYPEEVLASLLAVFANQMTLLNASNQDTLTGLSNRQTLDKSINKVANSLLSANRREEDTDKPIWIMVLMDIDHFKSVNDTYGHVIGDEVLVHLAQIMQSSFREDDSLFRYGGEEFAILLRNITPEHADIVLNRFRQRVEDYNFPQVDKVTISIGFAVIEPYELPGHIIAHADKALYYSKENGRNQVNFYQALIESGKLSETTTGDVELF